MYIVLIRLSPKGLVLPFRRLFDFFIRYFINRLIFYSYINGLFAWFVILFYFLILFVTVL